MTSYPFLPGPIPYSRRRPRPTAAGPARPARRIALEVRRRPEHNHDPW